MSRYRVMVVDDDPDVRYVVMALLSLEFETVDAQNGLDALEKIDRYEPDLLLLDINMPIMNGIACCHAIQRNPEFERLPVFFITAASGKAAREQASSVGGKGYIEKPFESAVLIDQLKGFFETERIPPRTKRYTPDEIAKIDATPLISLGTAAPEPAVARPRREEADTQELVGREESGGPRKRRVFGRQKPAAQAAPPAPEPETQAPVVEPAPPPAAAMEKPLAPDDSRVELPPPPTPDYGRISAKYAERQKIEELREKKALGHRAPQPPPTQPPAAAPPPPVPKPTVLPPAGKVAPPTAPAPAVPPPAPARPSAQAAPPPPPPPQAPAASPADLLAQRRLAAIGKAGGQAALKPRLLVLIDSPQMLETAHKACKGIAEFLPLEDPVEAIELIARFQPDMVMMGIREQRYSGLQIGQMLRSNNRLSHIEILFVQGAFVESTHLNAAISMTRNPVLRPPLTESAIRSAIEAVTRKPGFSVRAKNLGYGAYVKEVLKSAEAELRQENKAREKQALAANVNSLARFMADELKDYKEPAGYEELHGIGRKVHVVRDEPV